jgi:dTDP-glucose 4,6-dehydratase
MKHVILGGDGFLGRFLARELESQGQEVVVCDITKSDLDLYETVPFIHLDITESAALEALELGPDDVVHHFAARLLVPIVKRSQRKEFFWSVNFRGTEKVLEWAYAKGCRKVIYFTTDMVYGHTQTTPRYEDHPREPIGPYGESKLASEKLCESYREKGMNITIFRPRMIIGPGRLGILEKLFRLVDANLPVPLIGNGGNHYQFISVFDCVSAVLCALEKGVPPSTYNLGSADPPTVNRLLGALIREAGSKSFLVRTPAGLVKRTLALLDILGVPLMDPEQYLIADETCVLDVSKAAKELGWRPSHTDEDMLVAAYKDYRDSRSA